MHPSVIAASFGLLFVAELPDKTFIAELMLATRYRALPVWIGSAGALGVHVGIAVGLGRVLGFIPHRALDIVVAALFGAGAAFLFVGRESGELREAEEEALEAIGAIEGPEARDELTTTVGQITEESLPGGMQRWKAPQGRSAGFARIAAISFGIIFLGEWGDLTQLLTVNMAARYRDVADVALGAIMGLSCAVGLAVVAGRALLRFVSLTVLRKVSGVVLLGFCAWSVVEAVRA